METEMQFKKAAKIYIMLSALLSVCIYYVFLFELISGNEFLDINKEIEIKEIIGTLFGIAFFALFPFMILLCVGYFLHGIAGYFSSKASG